LRYLADAYKALRQTVPEEARTEELADLTEWLGELVRQVDSSLLDEWERLRSGDDAAAGGARAAALRRAGRAGRAGRLGRGGVGGRAGTVLRRARRDRHRPGRPRPGTADHRGGARPLERPSDLRRRRRGRAGGDRRRPAWVEPGQPGGGRQAGRAISSGRAQGARPRGNRAP